MYFRGLVDDVLHYGRVWCVVYSYAAIEHDKHNGRDSNQILLIDEDQQVVLIVSCAPRGPSLLFTITLSRHWVRSSSDKSKGSAEPNSFNLVIPRVTCVSFGLSL